MTFNVQVDVLNGHQRMQSISRFVQTLQSPKMPVIASKRVAAVWAKNFAEEGSMVGGWADLEERTEDIRESQGFGRAHPILQRNSALRDVAIYGFMRDRPAVTGQYAWSATDSYSRHPTIGSLTIRKGKATMAVHGWKVTNQWGFPQRAGLKPVPARPFWFVNPTVEAHATKGVAIAVSSAARKA